MFSKSESLFVIGSYDIKRKQSEDDNRELRRVLCSLAQFSRSIVYDAHFRGCIAFGRNQNRAKCRLQGKFKFRAFRSVWQRFDQLNSSARVSNSLLTSRTLRSSLPRPVPVG